jgi:hypothetical protein
MGGPRTPAHNDDVVHVDISFNPCYLLCSSKNHLYPMIVNWDKIIKNNNIKLRFIGRSVLIVKLNVKCDLAKRSE